jgi:hypothetical protein
MAVTNVIVLLGTRNLQMEAVKVGCYYPRAVVAVIVWIYAISTYHHWCCEFESRSGGGVKHYVIKFVSDFRQVGGLGC